MSVTTTAQGVGEATALCPSGMHVTGGGYTVNSDNPLAWPWPSESHPTSDGRAWLVRNTTTAHSVRQQFCGTRSAG